MGPLWAKRTNFSPPYNNLYRVCNFESELSIFFMVGLYRENLASSTFCGLHVKYIGYWTSSSNIRVTQGQKGQILKNLYISETGRDRAKRTKIWYPIGILVNSVYISNFFKNFNFFKKFKKFNLFKNFKIFTYLGNRKR